MSLGGRNMGTLLAKLGWTPEGHRRQELPVASIERAAAEGRDGQVVKIRGRVVAAAEGPLLAPFSGRVAIAARVQYLKRSLAAGPGLLGRGPVDDWNSELDERRAVPFWIDDGTGRALVLIEGASIDVPGDDVEIPASMRAAVHAFLDERAVIRATAQEGARMLEARIAPGDAVEVIGPARRESLEHGNAYRQPSAPSLVLFATEGPEGSLGIRRLP